MTTVVARSRIGGTVRVPPSKSVTHRAYLLAAQSDVDCVVRSPLRAADTDATLACLHRLGHAVRPEPDHDAVAFRPAPAVAPHEVLDCRNAGTALRLLAGVAARHPFPITLDGDGSLRKRPNGPLLDALRSLGATVRSNGDQAPITVQGPIHPGLVGLPPATSSQFISSLLLSLPMLTGPSVIEVPSPVSSRPYLDITRDTMTAFALHLDIDESDAGLTFHVPGGQVPSARRFDVEGDWSAAAFPMVAAAITGGEVTVLGLGTDSSQGDRAVVEVLRSFGAEVTPTDEGIRVAGAALHSPGTVDVAATPDLFPAAAVLAACSTGTTRFEGAAALRHKECDRIAAMQDGLRAMGARVESGVDWCEVTAGPLRGASVSSRDDHRIHMALCVAGLAADGKTVVDGSDSAAISFPDFHDHMRAAGAEFTQEAAA